MFYFWLFINLLSRIVHEIYVFPYQTNLKLSSIIREKSFTTWIKLLRAKRSNNAKVIKYIFRTFKVNGTYGESLGRIIEILERGETLWDHIFFFEPLKNLKKYPSPRVRITFHTRFDSDYSLRAIKKVWLFQVTNPQFYFIHRLQLVELLQMSWKKLNLLLRVNFQHDLRVFLLDIIKRTFGFGYYYVYGAALIFFIDACLTDDEPLWEPIEWSLVQSWILIIFSFAWIAENLIVSRYGSYTGRDKRVWFAWYKTFWLIEGYYIINYGAACFFVIVPFYYETNYNLSFVYSWWNWYSKTFFFRFISVYTLVMLLSYFFQSIIRWSSWRVNLFFVILINIFLSYLLYTQFITTFFAYFTDPIWYQKTRPVDYIQLSHEPARWGWGPAKKDHFTYHGVRTVLWFKSDGPFATSFLLFQTFLFVCLFLLYIYWIALFRRIYATKETPLTFTTYCVSALRQFFYFFMFFYLLVGLSYAVNYARFPVELLWTLESTSWLTNFFTICRDYPSLITSFFI